MKKGYQSVQMRVWRYSEDIVRTSGQAGTMGASLNNFDADNGKEGFEEGEFTCGW
jgi:hypothetical protein